MDTRKTKKKDGKARTPNRKGRRVTVFLEDDSFDALERYVADQEIEPSISDVLRLAARRFFENAGYLPKEKP